VSGTVMLLSSRPWERSVICRWVKKRFRTPLTFRYDITPYLKNVGSQELIVRVYDPTDLAGIPRGKQRLHLAGFMYTSARKSGSPYGWSRSMNPAPWTSRSLPMWTAPAFG